ncbi:MAG TPA: outer membrane protein transport protein, partial [Hyphomicrobium sp.]|nr:outer membrane protein transport protein [Hyphomicrobium sp.]
MQAGELMRLARTACASVLATAITAGPAFAGGFDVREQSALFQGMSFAGAAAGGTSLASMFWNPAAAGYSGQGLTFDSSYSLIIPRADVTVESVTFPTPGGLVTSTSPFAGTPFEGLDPSVDVGRDALVPASYMAYRYSSDLVFALSINSQFGLGTKPDNTVWAGDLLARSSKLFSVNAAPTVAYQIAPGVQIGAGVQIQYLDLMHLNFAQVPGGPTATLEGTDWGFGYTLGVNFNPAPGTSIGIGFRSSIEHDLDGSVRGLIVGSSNRPIGANLELPEKITGSITQVVMPGVRLHGTVEWTNWSRLQEVPIEGFPPAALSFGWEDGWYFAIGGEYDYSEKLTLRTGFGYEISPIQDPEARLVQLPDNDRYWLSAGGTYAA